MKTQFFRPRFLFCGYVISIQALENCKIPVKNSVL